MSKTAENYSVEGCEFAFKCPRQWEQLSETDSADQRHCAVCNRTVYRCDDASLLEVHARARHCVAVPDRQRDGYYVGTLSATDYKVTRVEWDS